MLRKFLVASILCAGSFCSQSQSRFVFETGLIARVTVGQDRGANKIQGGVILNNAPYESSKGVDGTGMNLTIGYRLSKKYDVIIRSGTTIRYDFFYWKSENVPVGQPPQRSKAQNTVYVDQAFFITKSFLKGYVGVGTTMFSIGKEFTYNNGNGDKTLSLDFNSIDLLFGFPVWKLQIEPKISYVQKGFPGKVKETATILGTRIYYRFKI